MQFVTSFICTKMKLMNILNISKSLLFISSHVVFKMSTFRHQRSLTLLTTLIKHSPFSANTMLVLSCLHFTQPRQEFVQSGPCLPFPGKWHKSAWSIAFNQRQILLISALSSSLNHFRGFWLNFSNFRKNYLLMFTNNTKNSYSKEIQKDLYCLP